MKRGLTFFILVFSLLAPVCAQSPNPDLNVAAIQYNTGALPQNLQQYLPETEAARFQWIGSGRVDLSAYPLWHSDYMDSGGASYPPSVYAYFHDVAAAHGWNYESMFLHFNLDYTVPGGAAGPTGWSNMDCFDVFEQQGGSLNGGVGACASANNGALIVNGSAYNDVTRSLYAGTCGPTCEVSNGLALYLGYAEPFALINLTMSTPLSGDTATWQYWNGSGWATLNPTSDTTNGLTRNGTIKFSPPVAWTATIFNNSQSKYWVRLNVTGIGTAPVLSRVWGDDWTSNSSSCSGPCDDRGWDPAHCQSGLVTMNNGIQYCAQSSASATAQFRYQGRASGYWTHNYLFINPGDSQGGQLTFVAALIARWAAQRSPANDFHPNALMLDNVGEHPQPAYPLWDPNLTDAPCSPTCSSGDWQNYINALMPAITAGIKRTYPNVVAVGGNDSTDIYKSFFDFNVWELGGTTFVIGNLQYSFDHEFDSWLPEHNTTGSKAVIALWDNQHFNLKVTRQGQDTYHLWDGGNRTPMLTLASYYIAANENNMMLYNTQGWSYFDTAEFYIWSTTATSTLASSLSASPSGGTINVTDASQFAKAGGPVYHNDYVLRIGSQDVLRCTKSGNSFTTTGPIVNSYPPGTKVEFALVEYWADPNHPTSNATEIWYYANWFPAMWVDIGTPDPAGWNGGARDIAYSTGTSASGQPSCQGNQCAEVWRRDFTNAVILDRVLHDTTLASEWDLPGPPINLVDPAHKLNGPYYRLNSDGTTGPAITSLTLVGGEAAILMKNPVGSGGGGTLSAPTLNLPPFLPINAKITAGYNGTDPVDHFNWTFTPTSGSGSGASGHDSGLRTRDSGQAGSGAGTASFSTKGAQADLSTQPLILGPYLVTVQAIDGSGNASSVTQANTTLVPGDLSGVREYPNPWRSNLHSGHAITFDNLTVNTTIKLFTVSGHWVKTLPTSSTSVTWDLTNDSDDQVGSGIYLYQMKTDSGQKATGKLVIIK